MTSGRGCCWGWRPSYKVTPALFFLYFAYKRSWRTLSWGLLGMGIFLLIVPSMVIGPQFNGECLGMWWHRMVTPFVVKGATSRRKSISRCWRVLTRLLTDLTPGQGRYDTHLEVNLLSLPPWMVGYLFKAVAVAPGGTAGVSVPDQDDRPPRPAAARGSRLGCAHDAVSLRAELEAPLRDGAASLHLSGLRILFDAGRSPRPGALGRLVGAVILLDGGGIARLGRPVRRGQGHEIAQGYGSFLWAGVVLYAMVAWRVWSRRSGSRSARLQPESRLVDSQVSSRVGSGPRPIVAS